MAVLQLKATEADPANRTHAAEVHGKLRIMTFHLPAVAVAGDIGTTIDLGTLPAGKVKVLTSMSKIKASAFGAARTLEIGHPAYQKRDSASEPFEAADDNAFSSVALNVAAATNDLPMDATQLDFDLYSKNGVLVQAVVKGGTIPVGATLEGFIVYATE